MSISSAPMMPNFTPMKKKVIAVIAAVIIGHTGVMWALKNMKAPELQPVEKKPLKVRFVKIQEQQQPLPPKPKAEPKKEKSKPKEVKIVEKPLQPKVEPKPIEKKIVATKTQKTEPKKVQQDDTLEKQKMEQQRLLEQQRLDQLKRDQEEKDRAARDKAQRDQEAREKAQSAPKKISIGGAGAQWSRTPRPTYTNSDLQGQNRSAVVRVEVNEKGIITSARVTRSSGISALDEKILRAVRNAKFKPYKENGIAVSFITEQPFDLTLSK